MFCKSVIKNPTCFGPYSVKIFSEFVTFRLPASAGSCKVVNALSTKDDLKDGHRIRTETCRGF
jgi:hypothetical protein